MRFVRFYIFYKFFSRTALLSFVTKDLLLIYWLIKLNDKKNNQKRPENEAIQTRYVPAAAFV